MSGRPRQEGAGGFTPGTDVTIAICTHNRSRLLRSTLEAMERLSTPDGCRWELVVVNNACTDDTDDVVAAFAGRLPIRGIHEPQPGKSHAANTAVREARGRYMVWTDDDVLVSASWLSSYWDAFQRYPDVPVFGGPIEAAFEGTPPSWVRTMLTEEGEGRLWAVVDPGEEVTPFRKELIPLGANMAFKREAHLRVPFDTRIGPRPGSEIRGEETLVIHTLMDRGERGLWIPDARVRHVVPEARQTTRYVRSFFFGVGQTFEILNQHEPRHALLRAPAWMWRQAVRCEIMYWWWRMLGREARWLRNLMHASIAWGYLWGGGRHPSR